jgi:hypothetical protein
MKNFEIYIITLQKYFKHSAIRTQKLIQRLKQFDVNPNNINFIGINGLLLKNKKINSKYISNEKYNFLNNLGTLGASLSHGLILKHIQLKKTTKDILILEEDALLTRLFDNFCKNIKFPVDYDICYLHSFWPTNFYLQDQNVCSSDVFLKNTIHWNNINIPSSLIEKNKHKPFNKIVKEIDYNTPCGIVAYLVNGNRINKIIETIFPIKESTDWHYWSKYKELNQYIVNPQLKLVCTPYPEISYRELFDHEKK